MVGHIRLSWLDSKKATINPTNKKDNKCFKYTVTVVINYDIIKRDPQRITKIKPFINKYYWENIDFPSGKEKKWKQLLLIFFMLKQNKYTRHMFQNKTEIVKNKLML